MKISPGADSINEKLLKNLNGNKEKNLSVIIRYKRRPWNEKYPELRSLIAVRPLLVYQPAPFPFPCITMKGGNGIIFLWYFNQRTMEQGNA